jgi:methionine-rich copper-binding protein CopC
MKRAIISLISLAILLVPVNANAHAGVVATSPAQDEILTAMPTDISVEFTDDLLTISGEKVNSISLNYFDGPPVELTDVIVDGRTISAKIPEGNYEAGTYEVFYTIVSADGHKVSDSFSFSLNAPTPLIAPTPRQDKHGTLPLPIVGAIALVIVIGGIYAFRARNNKR